MWTRRHWLMGIAAQVATFLGVRRTAMITTTNLDRQQADAATLPRPQAGELREIASIHAAPGLHWVGDGFRVAGYFSAIPDVVRMMDPFLLLDYHPAYDYAPTERPRGVG